MPNVDGVLQKLDKWNYLTITEVFQQDSPGSSLNEGLCGCFLFIVHKCLYLQQVSHRDAWIDYLPGRAVILGSRRAYVGELCNVDSLESSKTSWFIFKMELSITIQYLKMRH